MKIVQFSLVWLLPLILLMGPWQLVVELAHSESITTGSHDSLTEWTDPLSKTVVRYFKGQSNYLDGDLIVRSQVAELQAYLRKTQGACAATNPLLRRRVLVDHSCLARAFYSLGGDRLLREAAGILGGYGPLDRLCQTKAGRAILTTAVRQANLEMLLGYLHKHELPPKLIRISQRDTDNQQKHLVQKLSRIYTVEELLKALHSG